MNELYASVAMLDTAPDDEAAAAGDAVRRAPLEFVGSSDETIAEAVRRALFDASSSLTTLDGMGVVVIPQIGSQGAGPRFQVTLKISPQAEAGGS